MYQCSLFLWQANFIIVIVIGLVCFSCGLCYLLVIVGLVVSSSEAD